MSTSLVVTGGTTDPQYNLRTARPTLRDAPLEGWLLRQPEYFRATGI